MQADHRDFAGEASKADMHSDIHPDFRLEIASEQLAVRQGLAQILAAPCLCDLDPEFRGRIEIVLAEVLNNIVEHAYAHREGTITLEVSAQPSRIECRVLDCGREMPGLTLPEGKLAPHDPDDLPEGGFGWFLIRSLTHELRYTRQNGRNELRFHLPETVTEQEAY